MLENGKSWSPSSSRRPSLRVEPAGRRHERIVLEAPLRLTFERPAAWIHEDGQVEVFYTDGISRKLWRDLPAGAVVWIRHPSDQGPPIEAEALEARSRKAIGSHLRAWAEEMRKGPIWRKGFPEMILARADRVEAGDV